MTPSRPMKTLALTSLLPLVLLGACMKEDADEFRDGVPTREAAELKVPGGGAQTGALTGVPPSGDVGAVKSALLGQRAEFYTLTRAVTAVVNTGTVAILGLVRTITLFPPTHLQADTAVWGPHTEPLSPNTWRLTVTRIAPHQFEYKLDAKDKTKSDDNFLTTLSGTHTRALRPTAFPPDSSA